MALIPIAMRGVWACAGLMAKNAVNSKDSAGMTLTGTDKRTVFCEVLYGIYKGPYYPQEQLYNYYKFSGLRRDCSHAGRSSTIGCAVWGPELSTLSLEQARHRGI